MEPPSFKRCNPFCTVKNEPLRIGTVAGKARLAEPANPLPDGALPLLSSRVAFPNQFDLLGKGYAVRQELLGTTWVRRPSSHAGIALAATQIPA
jgi:hypothetical protein